MRIIFGTVLVVLLVTPVIIPGSLRSGSGSEPNLWVNNILVHFGQSANNWTLCSAKFLRLFFGHFCCYFFWDLCYVVFIHSRSICVPWQVVPRILLQLSLLTTANSLLFPNAASWRRRRIQYFLGLKWRFTFK